MTCVTLVVAAGCATPVPPAGPPDAPAVGTTYVYEFDSGSRIQMVYDGIVDIGARRFHWLDQDKATPFPLPVISALDTETGGHTYREHSEAEQHPTITLPIMEWDRPPGRHDETIGRYHYQVEVTKAGDVYSVHVFIRVAKEPSKGQPYHEFRLSHERGQLVPDWIEAWGKWDPHQDDWTYHRRMDLVEVRPA